jgi:hypothetical protein
MIAALAVLAAAAAPAPADPADRLAPSRVRAVVVRDGIGWVGRSAGLTALDLTDPAAPREIGELRLPATVEDVALAGAFVYVAAGTHGLYVVDASGTAGPRLLGELETPGSARRIAVAGPHHVLVADHREGLVVVDVSRPDRPAPAARVPTRGELVGLALRDGLLATAEGMGGVRLFDVSRPERPLETGLAPRAEGAQDVAFAGDRLLVAAGRRGLLVYRLDELRRPTLETELAAVAPAEGVAVGAGIVVVAGGTAGLQVLEWGEQRGEPRPVARLRLPGGRPAGRTTLDGALAFVAADRWDFAVLDLTDPAAPRVLRPRDKPLRVVFRE